MRWLIGLYFSLSFCTLLRAEEGCVDPISYEKRGSELRTSFDSLETLHQIFSDEEVRQVRKADLQEALRNIHSRYDVIDQLVRTLFQYPEIAGKLDQFLGEFYSELDPKNFWELHLRVKISDVRYLGRHIMRDGPLPEKTEILFSLLINEELPDFKMDSKNTKSLMQTRGSLNSQQIKSLKESLWNDRLVVIRQNSSGQVWRVLGFTLDESSGEMTKIILSSSEDLSKPIEVSVADWSQNFESENLVWSYKEGQKNISSWIFYPN